MTEGRGGCSTWFVCSSLVYEALLWNCRCVRPSSLVLLFPPALERRAAQTSVDIRFFKLWSHRYLSALSRLYLPAQQKQEVLVLRSMIVDLGSFAVHSLRQVRTCKPSRLRSKNTACVGFYPHKDILSTNVHVLFAICQAPLSPSPC